MMKTSLARSRLAIALLLTLILILIITFIPSHLTTALLESANVASPCKCNNKSHPENPPGATDWPEFYTILMSISLLVPLGGIFAGLTIGLLSLDPTNLNILKHTGTPQQKQYAARVQPLLQDPHLLLVSLLIANTAVNETLPVLLHVINLDGYQAVLVSTCLVLLFGEIIPQAVCARHGLAVGAFFSTPLRLFIGLIWIVAYPIAKLLDYVLGDHQALIYRRAELRELVALHGEDAGGSLTKDEVSILRAVLDISDKTVSDIMTKLSSVFMLEIDTPLDKATLEAILQAGHSRIPVYRQSRDLVVGVILVKQLIMADPNQATHLTDYKVRRLPRIMKNTPLFDILHVFEEGGSHMALVVDEYDSECPESDTLRQSTVSGITGRIPSIRRTCSAAKDDSHTRNGSSNRYSLTKEQLYTYSRVSPILRPTDPHTRLSTATPPQRLSALNIVSPRLAPTPDVQSDAPLTQYRTLGIVTLEDVIEELLGQEIVDETDVYIDIDRRIKVARALGHIALVGTTTNTLPIPSAVPSAANSLHMNGINLDTINANTSEPRATLFGVGGIFSKHVAVNDEERQPLLQTQASDEYIDALEDQQPDISIVINDDESPKYWTEVKATTVHESGSVAEIPLDTIV